MFQSQEECDRVFTFIASRELVESCTRENDDRAVLPTEKGIAWIESHKEKWTIDRRLVALTIFVALVGAAIALLQKP